ncbi:MAG: radical SAM family heme chaperone HemW [Firmicutes bacterium]|nr:radical SAM family heme chaperone HemW [Bacillota bacterium]
MAAGIYIHIPFCLRKCYYCDFFSKAVDDKDLREQYAMALVQEINFYGKKYGKGFSADSIFFGGGTPSLMEPKLINSIISALKKNFDIAEDAEITMECNPATVDSKKLSGYRKAGVNRISIGAQSFDEKVLENIGRLHKVEDIKKTVKMAHKVGIKNINLDLMFAVPGLTVMGWRKTVKKALSLRPEHISFYSLEIAEDTVFGHQYKMGKLKETPIFIDRKMYHDAIKIMKKRGFEHYEISNMALPGKESRHNKKYWQFEDYLGLGASAHSFIKGVRYSNVSSIEEYIKIMRSQDLYDDTKLGNSETYATGCVDSFHVNTFDDNVSEYVFTALRTREGVIFEDFEAKVKNEFWDIFGKERNEFEKYVKSGHAISDEKHIALTEEGMDISNTIMAIFV